MSHGVLLFLSACGHTMCVAGGKLAGLYVGGAGISSVYRLAVLDPVLGVPATEQGGHLSL